MDANQMILVIIVMLASLIVVFGIYFLIVALMNKKRTKKVKTIFDSTNLVEEESLMNVLDEKRNLEYNTPTQTEERFVMNQDQVQMVKSNSLTQEEKVNPFGVDLTMRSNDNVTLDIPNENEQNRFFK